MADRTQLKIADRHDIASDDPFAELTRIMGFDPREPAKPQSVVAAQPMHADDSFDIDLEKELMGEFDGLGIEAANQSSAHSESFAQSISFGPAIEAGHQAQPEAGAAAPDSDEGRALSLEDEIAASFGRDFDVDDDAPGLTLAQPFDFAPAANPASEEQAGPQEAADEPEAFAAPEFEPGEEAMDDAFARSFADPAHVEDDASGHGASLAPPVVAPSEAPDSGVSESSPEWDDPLQFDAAGSDLAAEQTDDELVFGEPHEEESPRTETQPAQAAAEIDFDAHFDNAMADVDMDFTARPELAAVQALIAGDAEPFEEALDEAAVETANGATAAFDQGAAYQDSTYRDSDVAEDEAGYRDETAYPDEGRYADVPQVGAAAEDHDFDLDASFGDEASIGDSEPALAAATQPTAPPPVQSAVATIRRESTLEDELNALLSKMTPRSAATATDSWRAPVKPAIVEERNWARDRDEATPAAVEPDHADLGAVLLADLEATDFDIDPELGNDFDVEAFDAALASETDWDGEGASTAHEDPIDSLNRLASGRAEPESRIWSRGTPVVPPQSAVAWMQTAQPVPAGASTGPEAPYYRAVSAEAFLGDEPVHEAVAGGTPPDQEPASASDPLPAYESMPDVETIDVPERVVALADDLDIPELDFDDDQPEAQGYDDLDAEFASLLSEMNAVEPAPVRRAAAYDDDAYGAGYRREPVAAQADFRPDPETAAHADSSFDAVDLPGSQSLAEDDGFVLDDPLYDPDLEDEMTVPGLVETDARRRPRGRGLMIAGIIGVVAVAGGVGAFALSFGGKGGSDAPAIVKADNAPIKVKPENPGGTVIPNQDNKVYDVVANGAKPAEPTQQKLVADTQEPVDVSAKPAPRVVELKPDGNAGAADTAVKPGIAAAAPKTAVDTPSAKSEDRVEQVAQDNTGAAPEVALVAPRKVRTMMVKPDGSLVPREDPAPSADVSASEPADPAPQHVVSTDQTGAVSTDVKSAVAELPVEAEAKPAATARAQSATTPQLAPIAPQRPSDQPVDIVGEVKPDQVASIDTGAKAAAGSWSMQIASQPTADSAQTTYQDLARRYSGVLNGRGVNIVKADIAGKGTFYRVRVPAQSRNDAVELCTSYKAAGGNCFVSK